MKALTTFIESGVENFAMTSGDGKSTVKLSSDMISVSKELLDKTATFIDNKGIGAELNNGGVKILSANESIEDALGGIDKNDVLEFVTGAGVPEEFAPAATNLVGSIIAKSVGSKSSGAWANHNHIASEADLDTKFTNYADILPAKMLDVYSSVEEFGADMDRSTVDLKAAIAIAIMSFQTRLTPRALAVMPVAQPAVTYKREETLIMNLSDATSTNVPLIDIYHNPAVVENELKPIEVLKTNGGSEIVRDGVLAFAQEANLLKLSIDSSKPTHAEVNRTDLVDDSVFVDGVYVNLNAGATNEEFLITIPQMFSKFFRGLEGSSYTRFAAFKFPALLKNGAAMSNTTASTLLTGMGADEGIEVIVECSGTTELTTGVTQLLGKVSIAAKNTKGAAISSATTTLLGTLTASLIGYGPNAKFSEENVRKSDIAVKTTTDTLSFAIPQARNYIHEFPLGQSGGDRQAATLNAIIGTGQDYKVYKTIEGKLGEVQGFNQLTSVENPIISERDIAKKFVAGCLVKPHVELVNLDVSLIPNEKAADRPGDIKQYMQTALNGIITKVEEKTLIRQQLPRGTAPTYTVITTGELLGNLLGVKHIHNHLDAGKRGTDDGIEYTLVLDNGSTLRIVTTTFNDANGKMLIIPVVPGNNASVLNWGHNWDFGTMIAQYVSSQGAVFQRYIANSRELPVATNPMGAIVTIAGIDKVNFITP